jgi:hypothetical protein
MDRMTQRSRRLVSSETTLGSLRRRMVDEAMEAYVEWREECIRVDEAYRGWLSAVRADAALAFPAYVAALDREERASEVYAGVIHRLERLLATSTQGDGERPAPGTAAS